MILVQECSFQHVVFLTVGIACMYDKVAKVDKGDKEDQGDKGDN